MTLLIVSWNLGRTNAGSHRLTITGWASALASAMILWRLAFSLRFLHQRHIQLVSPDLVCLFGAQYSAVSGKSIPSPVGFLAEALLSCHIHRCSSISSLSSGPLKCLLSNLYSCKPPDIKFFFTGNTTDSDGVAGSIRENVAKVFV